MSADSELTGLKARRAVLASASGNFSLICCEIGTLSATAASGDVSLRKGFWNEGRIATGSGDLSVIGCRLRRLEQYSTSGDVSILTSAAEELVFRTVSGDVDVKGSVRALQAATVSGDLHLVAAAAPERLFFRSTSGDGKLHLPEGTAFTLDLSTVSGSLRTGPFTGEREESSRHTVFRCGGDGPVYEIRTTSGDVSLHVNPAAPGETV